MDGGEPDAKRRRLNGAASVGVAGQVCNITCLIVHSLTRSVALWSRSESACTNLNCFLPVLSLSLDTSAQGHCNLASCQTRVAVCRLRSPLGPPCWAPWQVMVRPPAPLPGRPLEVQRCLLRWQPVSSPPVPWRRQRQSPGQAVGLQVWQALAMRQDKQSAMALQAAPQLRLGLQVLSCTGRLQPSPPVPEIARRKKRRA